MPLGRLVPVVLASALVFAAPARAEPAVGLVGTSIASFDTAAPSQVSVRPITGLVSGSERAVGLDWRPRTGQVALVTVPVGVAANALVRTYMLDPSTAAAAFVGSIPNTVPGAADVPTGIDLNPTVDRIRVVNVNDANFRINPTNGSLAGSDVNLTPAGTAMTAVAYDRNFDRATTNPPTTLFGITRSDSGFATLGGIDGMAPGGSPNGGVVRAIGTLGVTLAPGSDAGLDVSPNTGTAFASLHSTGQPLPSLHTINPATGAATLVGALPVDVTDLTVLPNPPAPTPAGGGGGGGGGTSSGGSTPGPTVAPPPIPLPPTVDGLPVASLTLPRKATLGTALRGRLKVGFTCDRACTAVATLVKGAASARAAAARALAAGTTSLASAGRGSIALRPTRAGKKALRGARGRHRSIRTTVVLAVTDATGAKAAPVTHRLTVRR